MSVQIYGTYDRTLFRDEKSGATGFTLKPAVPVREQNKFGSIVCTGRIISYPCKMPLLVSGEFSETDYGKQLVLHSVREYVWDKNSAVTFLSSGAFEDVGFAAASEIADKVGYDLFTLAYQNDIAQRMKRACRKISLKTAKGICERLRLLTAARELFDYLKRYDGNWSVTERLVKVHGEEAKVRLCEHPYTVGMASGLSFNLCDRLGKDLGFHPVCKERLEAISKTALRRLASEGHVFAPYNDVYREVGYIAKQSSFDADIPETLLFDSIRRNDELVIEEGTPPLIYLRNLYEAETGIAESIKRLTENARSLPFEDKLIQYAEQKCGMLFQNEQRQCFDLIKKTGIAVITGTPGTGKTSCVAGLLCAYEKMCPGKTVRLCAPTGRAAQRLAESTGRDAVTIHRLLSCNPEQRLRKESISTLDADLIVVDEGSMLSVVLADMLLSAVKNGALVLIIGDINQLPSVEAGDVLHDIIYSEAVSVCQLRKVHRQASDSPIIRNAGLINAGFYDIEEDERFTIRASEKQEGIADNVLMAVRELYNPKQPFATQVLSPVYRQEAGVSRLNKLLQAALNPKKEQRELWYGGKVFRERDKVILLSNNYAMGYYNGDIGIITEVGEAFVTAQIGDRQVCLTSGMLDDIDLAYCISIHKAQGSEFRNVILVLPNVQNLSKNLLYTGITRAKERLVLLPQHGAVYTAVEKECVGRRNSLLIQRIQNA